MPARADVAAQALAQYRRRAASYDLELVAFEPYRVEAIALLQLAPGDTVLDIGCGTGLSLQRLCAGVGASGHVIGIEPCPEMLERARARVARHGLTQVELVQSGAATAPLHGKADAALFHFTHDVVRDEAALAHVLAHLKPGARVVATGLQWSPLWPVNAFVALAALYSVTRLEGLGQPWDRLASHLQDVQVRSSLLGGIYVASGRYAGLHRARAAP